MPNRAFEVVRVWMVIGTFAAIVLHLTTHEATTALPRDIPSSIEPYKYAEYTLASADAVKDVVGLVITIALGLTAVVGFAIRDGLGNSCVVRFLSLAGVCAFVFLITRIFVLGYDCYAAIATQLDRGFYFITRLEQIVLLQAESVVLAALIALLLFFIAILQKRER